MKPPLVQTNSLAMFEQAKTLFPGGVNSPVRAFGSVGGTPPVISHGQGPYLYDVDANRYVDYVCSYGPLVLGHSHPQVVKAITEAANTGASFGMPTAKGIELAELIQRQMPNLEMMRFVNSGTEAVMSALRLARAFSGRNKIVKFAGCYHGHADMLLVQAGSGVATLGLPDSPGVTPATTADTLVADFNNPESVAKLFAQQGSDIAAIIVEPVAGNMGMIEPSENFLKDLRNICDSYGSLLIFDEVMTGFRVHRGGAQTLYEVKPDLTTLGKVIGGGLPVGAYGGRSDIMAMIAPSGDVYQAGTLSANPLAMAAGVETLNILCTDNNWDQIETQAEGFTSAMSSAAENAGVAISASRLGSMAGLHLLGRGDPGANNPAPSCWDDVNRVDREIFAKFFHAMLREGVFLAPSPFEAAFVSIAHNSDTISQTHNAATVAFSEIASRS